MEVGQSSSEGRRRAGPATSAAKHQTDWRSGGQGSSTLLRKSQSKLATPYLFRCFISPNASWVDTNAHTVMQAQAELVSEHTVASQLDKSDIVNLTARQALRNGP